MKILVNWYKTSCFPITAEATALGYALEFLLSQSWVHGGVLGAREEISWQGDTEEPWSPRNLKTWGTGITTLQCASRKSTLDKSHVVLEKADRAYASPSTWYIVGASWIFTERIDKWMCHQRMYQKSSLCAKRIINFHENFLMFCWTWDCILCDFQNLQQLHIEKRENCDPGEKRE